MALKEDALISLFIISGERAHQGNLFGRINIVSPEQTAGLPVTYVNEKGQEVVYNPSPVQFGGVEISGSNKLPTPKVRFANVDGGMTAHFTPDTWYFNRKIEESKLGVSYELASIFDVEGLSIPKRRLYTNFCPFAYRGPDCKALEAAPEEVCGVVQEGKAIRCENKASEPTQAFLIDAATYLKYVPDTIFHSHPDGIYGFSEHDIAVAANMDLISYVYVVETDTLEKWSAEKGIEVFKKVLNR